MSRVLIVNCHMDNSAYAVAADIGNPKAVHKLIVTRRHRVAIHLGNDSVTANLLDIGYPAAVDHPAICLLQALTDGMAGG